MAVALILLAAQAGVAVTKDNCHRWEAPEWAPWEMKALKADELGAPRPPIVFKDRAIVPHENGVLWLTKQGDRWGYVGWRKEVDISKDWLYQDGKTGTAAKPEGAADAYLQAIEANDPAAAEKHCTHRAWTAKPSSVKRFPERARIFGLRQIFQNTIKSKVELRRILLSERNRRCYILLTITQAAQNRGEFYLLLVRRRPGWLIDGIAEKEPEAARFLTSLPFRPAGAKALRDEVAYAFKHRASWRVRKLGTGSFREDLYKLYLQGPTEPGALTVHERSATLVLGKTTLTLVKHRYGWRVAGAGK